MKISIVTISLNQAQFLERTILSIINQSYQDLEYIVVDPGSTDGSRDIIESYRPRITKILYESDNGAAEGLNKGFLHATGDIFGFINSDDELLPNALNKIADHFEKHPKTDVICGCGFIIDSTGAVIKRIIPTRFSKRLFIYGAVTLFQQGIFFRKTAFLKTIGFNNDNKTCWDGEIFLDMAMNNQQFDILDENIAAFRIHDSSVSGSGRLVEWYKNDCKRLFMKALGREMNLADRLLKLIYRLEKWLMNPRVSLIRIAQALGIAK